MEIEKLQLQEQILCIDRKRHVQEKEKDHAVEIVQKYRVEKVEAEKLEQ